MGLFGFWKKKTTSENKTATKSRIKILGGGCTKCHDLESNTKKALQELNKKDDIELITDFAEIAKYGVLTTPALVLDNKVLSYGKVLTTKEVKTLLEENIM